MPSRGPLAILLVSFPASEPQHEQDIDKSGKIYGPLWGESQQEKI
jgi:hypothetical protein